MMNYLKIISCGLLLTIRVMAGTSNKPTITIQLVYLSYILPFGTGLLGMSFILKSAPSLKILPKN